MFDAMICSSMPISVWLFIVFITVFGAIVGALSFYDLWLARFVVPEDFEEQEAVS